MTDSEFLQQIEACTLPKDAFTHRNHVRLAWLYLSDLPGGDPDARIAGTIQRYATSINAATKYDHALTMRWMRRVEAAMAAAPAASFEAFITARPELLERSTPAQR
jgi:N-formylglutamate deformylase